MFKDAKLGGRKGQSKALCAKCFKFKINNYMDVYAKHMDGHLYYRCIKCGYTIWNAPASWAE